MELVVDGDEVREKDRRLREFLNQRGLAGLVVSGTHLFAWATCGRDNHVSKGAENGGGHALYTPDAKYLLCDNIEEGRLKDEERLEEQGFTFVTGPWYTFDLAAEVQKRVASGSVGADTPLRGATPLGNRDLAPLRYSLTPQERERYRWLGNTTARAMIRAARPATPAATKAVPGIDQVVAPSQAFAWNPSIAGDDGPEILTAASPDWPTRRFETPEGVLERPYLFSV
jgi:Xaa-Pro aminopeptidase